MGKFPEFCPHCHSTVQDGLPRCSHCGQRVAPVATGQKVEPVRKIDTETPTMATPTASDGFKSYVLDPVQREILVAATRGGNRWPIHVLPARPGGDGELKAGDQRMFGNDVVAALIGLGSKGLVVETEDACFELTGEGEHVGNFLQNPMRRAAAELWVPIFTG